MGFPVAGGEPITAADMNAAAGLPVADFASLPATGNWLGRLVATTDTSITYRWDGSAWEVWGSPWTDYTPVFGNFTLGNGTVDAAYTRLGKTVHYRCLITFGSTTAITGTMSVWHPVTAEVGESVMPTVLYRPDGGSFYLGLVTPSGATSSIMRVPVQTGGGDMVASSITATVPTTWATGGTISIAGTYEAS